MHKNFDIIVGVDDLRFTLIKNCAINFAPIHIRLSLSLKGSFLVAAEHDDIAHTVNYESLCKHIFDEIKMTDCTSFAKTSLKTKQAILGYSHLITGGSMSISMQCHEIFSQVFCLP